MNFRSCSFSSSLNDTAAQTGGVDKKYFISIRHNLTEAEPISTVSFRQTHEDMRSRGEEFYPVDTIPQCGTEGVFIVHTQPVNHERPSFFYQAFRISGYVHALRNKDRHKPPSSFGMKFLSG